MKCRYFLIILSILGLYLLPGKVVAQTDSIVTFESFDYDIYGNITYSSVNGYLFSSGRTERYKKENFITYAPQYYASVNPSIQNLLEKRILNKQISNTGSRSNDNGNSWVTSNQSFYVYDDTFGLYPIAEYYLPQGATANVPMPDFNLHTPDIDNRFRRAYAVELMDSKGRPIQVSDRAGIASCYLYSQEGQLTCQVDNGKLSDIAYTGFEVVEESFNTGWTFTDLQTNSMFLMPMYGSARFYQCESMNLDVNKTYILSLWCAIDNPSHSEMGYHIVTSGGSHTLLDTMMVVNPDAPNGAMFFKKFTFSIKNAIQVSLQSNPTAAGNYYIDELRLHPQESQMKTYRYERINGVHRVVRSADSRHDLEWLKYDNLGRLYQRYDKNLKLTLEKEYTRWTQ
ncbi:hypothetical protein U0038_01880 [Sphingobacterium spiritivorum]|uniref:Uncharacterized protein n=1 Tax=Sphingobacterium spiritivorum ATCC 33861 TaxID=525373 RepID=D7VHU2_SPHSI|nr:hypothetical protein [Sphingobacterium spiritivorum]EFK59644.1 hypothetical protein HMPREF0766_10561 [Sphingobacterium spiritivorum ATCC 33861]QQT37699.1 hypothetical protein I6J01_09950 [Sphingobacterium spiritivorum]WQD34502.1 hypothetical protein U0038_01880 [Sphingobacterium spiritivorum]SUI97484.1 Uncharacterised protein [Sphingobacterium spiritivorum]